MGRLLGPLLPYLLIALLLGGGVGGWKARGWYEASKENDTRKVAIARHNELTERDTKLARRNVKRQGQINADFKKLETQSAAHTATCKPGGNFNRVWNAANQAANQQTDTERTGAR